MPLENETAALQRRTEDIFHEALAVSGAERTSILERRCAGDTALMDELRSLLTACEAEERLASVRLGEARARAEDPASARWIGPYELDRLLGRGGMGSVYLAHRVDGQFRQQVAIKLIDAPLTTDLFRDRFRMERQILAGLVHPYIARLLDGGVSEDGDLYLAMEYVDGISISHYCQQNKLSLRDRLLLFKNVCGAVQFAHQNLVVHRDLKPDNILVVADGTPRLLDFGTAKLLIAAPADASAEFTQQGLRAFTPQYASPEQVLGKTITTASDIYSLGVLLYLLLAGALPYELKEFSTAEMLRVICEQVPAKPSAVPASAARTAEPLNTDLDAIVLKALRKEPLDRYATVEQFAADIQAYLERRPVLARRGTLRYRATKFIWRNRLAFTAAVLLFATVLLGLAGVLWQRRRVEARSEDLRQLSNSLLSEIDEAIKELPGSTPVQQLLVQRVLEHLDRMSKDAAGDRQTQLDLVGAYTQLGNLQGNIYEQNIGDPQGALVSLDKALVLARSLRSSHPRDADVLGGFALAQQSRSDVLLGVGRPKEAYEAIRSSVEAFDLEIARPGATPLQMANAATAYSDLGDQLGQPGFTMFGDSAGALDAYNKSLQLSLRGLAIDPDFIRSKRSVATAHIKIGNILVITDPVKAIDEYHQSLRFRDALPAGEKTKATHRRMVAMTYWELGSALTQALEYGPAIATLDQARDTMQQIATEDPKNMRAQYDMAATQLLEGLAYIDMLDPALNPRSSLDEAKNTQRAMVLLQNSIETKQRLLAVDPKNTRWIKSLAYAKAVEGTLMQRSGAAGDGAGLAASGVATLRQSSLASDASIDTLDNTVGVMLKVLPTSLRDTHLTVQLAERLVALTNRKTPEFLLELAQAYRADGQSEKGIAAAKEGLTLLPLSKPGDAVVRVQRLLEIEAQPGT